MDSYQREKREYQAHKLIYELNMQQDLTRKRVIGLPDLAKMYERVHCRKESAIKPSPALRYEFRDGVYMKTD